MQLVLNTEGLVMRVRDGVFCVSTGDEFRKFSPDQLNSIAITEPCMLSSAAVMLAAETGIPIYLFDRIGDAQACLRSPYFESISTLRRRQVYFSDDVEGAQWVLEQFVHKTEHQLQLLKWLKNRRAAYAKNIEETMRQMQEALEQLPPVKGDIQAPGRAWNALLMGWEGNQGRRYWSRLGALMPEGWQFKGRSRRPAKDRFNAVLNYSYGMLYTKVEQAIFAAGLDPHLGILHVDQYDRPTLAYDLIEPFRPWADRLIVEYVFSDLAEEDHFERFKDGFYLSRNGKRVFIPLFNEWLRTKVRWQGRQQSREQHIFTAAALLAKRIRKISKRPE